MGVVSGKNFPPFQRHIKIEEVDDGWCRYLSHNEAEIGLLLKNRPHNSGVTYPLALNPPSGARQQTVGGRLYLMLMNIRLIQTTVKILLKDNLKVLN